ncbi:MAG: phage capsid protein [Pseudomonadales bacterium]
MAFEIPAHFAESFTTNTELLLQEKRSKFAETVATDDHMGNKSAQVVKQFGEVEFQDNTTRNGDTNFSEIEHKQRWVFPTDGDLALPVDREDDKKMLNSPVSPYVSAMVSAHNRRRNRVFIAAALGDAKTGVNGGTTTAFDTANQQIAAGASGLTISKLRTAKEIFGGNEMEEEGDRFYIALSPKQRTDLLETTEVTSSDYNSVKALVAGDIDTFMGFKFILHNNLLVDGSANRRLVAWSSTAVRMAQWGGLFTRIGERSDKKYLTQVFMQATIGATRTQEKKVIEILCSEA